MADVVLSVQVSRTSLGLSPLEIAASPTYYCSPQFLGAAVSWDRVQVSSPWMDGDVTTSRRRRSVTEQIGVEVRGDSLADVRAAIDVLVAAFIQDSFTLTVTGDGWSRAYACEAGDYQDASWTTPRMAGAAGQVLLSVLRLPVPLAGVV